MEKTTRNKRWQKGNTNTFEHLQDSVLPWNDSALPSKASVTQTKPMKHSIPSCSAGRLAWTSNSAFTWAPGQFRNAAKRSRGQSQAGQRPPSFPRTLGQEEAYTQQLCCASASSPLVYSDWEGAGGPAEPQSCKSSASQVPHGKGICRCPSPAKISLIFICSEKFTSKGQQTVGKWKISGLPSLGHSSCKSLEGLWPRLQSNCRAKREQIEGVGCLQIFLKENLYPVFRQAHLLFLICFRAD